jgi:hypothetical protein
MGQSPVFEGLTGNTDAGPEATDQSTKAGSTRA